VTKVYMPHVRQLSIAIASGGPRRGRSRRREVTVLIAAVGRRRSGGESDVYELARKLLRQRLLR
jgi:hypothetical protein